jgi:hypothetical protein
MKITTFLPSLMSLKALSTCVLLMGCSATYAHSNFTHQITDLKKFACTQANAPQSLVGFDVVYQIEHNSANSAVSKGVIIKHFARHGRFTAEAIATTQGSLIDETQTYNGTYGYKRTSFNSAIETASDSLSNNTVYTTRFSFETESKGQWIKEDTAGKMLSSGSFIVVPSNFPADQGFAPETHENTSVALFINHTESELPTGVYPNGGLVLQSYAADGTMTLKGFGPGNIDSVGTYSYKKISAHSAVEVVTQVSDFFSLPYTMVYTYDTPTSGIWFQNFADGLILFSGTFNSFPN